MANNKAEKAVKQLRARAKQAGSIVVVILIITFLFRLVYTVSEQENAVVTQFGTVLRVDTAGTHFKAPWQSVKKVDITTHGTGIGYTVSKTGQNIVDTDNGIMITSDFNLLNIDFYMEYRVSDPVAYLYNTKEPEKILSNIAMANIRTVVSNYTVDEAMTTGKNQIQAEVKEAIREHLEGQAIGLSVVNITVQDSEPPTAEIIAAFKAVETAKQGAETATNNANRYRNEKIPATEAEADAMKKNAEATKAARIAEAKGEVARFNAMYEEYAKYPLITKKRMFYEAMEKLLPGTKVILTDGNTQTMLPLDSFSQSASSSYRSAPITQQAETPAVSGQ